MKILKNPWVILLAAMSGIILGLYASDNIVNLIAPIGILYIALLEMSIVPILVSAIVSSIARLVRSPNVGKFFLKYTTYACILLISASFIAVVIGLVAKPGVLNVEQQNAIGKIISSSAFETDLRVELNVDPATVIETNPGEDGWFYRFLYLLIPSNIFESLAQGKTLELVFFCIIFGVAIALVPRKQSDLMVTFMSSTFEAFQRIVDWAMYPLPIGLFVLVAKQVKDTGLSSLIAALRFLLTFYGVGIFIVIVTFIIISIKERRNFFQIVKIFLQPVLVSFSTRNSIATIPLGIEAIRDELGHDPVITSLVVPLSITICRFGNILYFALAAIYVGQIYEIDFTVGAIILVGLGAVIAGTATAGSTGFATLGMVSILLVDLLGLPSEAILIVFYAIDPIVDPMRTLLIVQPNLLLSLLVSPKGNNTATYQNTSPPTVQVSNNVLKQKTGVAV